jgi:hypothetical protein
MERVMVMALVLAQGSVVTLAVMMAMAWEVEMVLEWVVGLVMVTVKEKGVALEWVWVYMMGVVWVMNLALGWVHWTEHQWALVWATLMADLLEMSALVLDVMKVMELVVEKGLKRAYKWGHKWAEVLGVWWDSKWVGNLVMLSPRRL